MDQKLLIQIAGFLVGAGIAWGLMRGAMGTLVKTVDNLKSQLASIYARLEETERKQSLHQQEISGMAAMLSPEKVIEHVKGEAEVRTETNCRLQRLEEK